MLLALGVAAISAYNSAQTATDTAKNSTNPQPFGWPSTLRMTNGVTHSRDRANAFGIRFTQQAPNRDQHSGGNFSTPAFLVSEAFTPADLVARKETLGDVYNNDIPFSGYHNSENSWNRRAIRSLPNSDPFVADYLVPAESLRSNGLGPWPRDTAIGPMFTEKVLYDVDFVSTTGFNYSHGPSNPITNPVLDTGLQHRRFADGLFM